MIHIVRQRGAVLRIARAIGFPKTSRARRIQYADL